MAMTKMWPAPIAVALRAASALQRLVIAVHAREARPGGFVERDAELHLRDRVDQRLVNVLDGLDEVGLAHNDVAALGNFQRNRFQFHAK